MIRYNFTCEKICVKNNKIRLPYVATTHLKSEAVQLQCIKFTKTIIYLDEAKPLPLQEQISDSVEA